ncbi:MAG: DUF4921 family protein [Kiritimatiellae bacterium]|nr:DUF4921 family protein [Kiritimatiellia bacterium]
MYDYRELLTSLPDGTIRQRNPLTDIEVWTIPGRAGKQAANETVTAIQGIKKQEPENYCDLCEAKYFNTPPEKERLIKKDSGYVSLLNLGASELSVSRPVFRRIPNLFEIVTFDYWRKKSRLAMSPENKLRKEKYLSSEKGRAHVINAVNLKLKRLGREPSQVDDGEKLSMADAFFSGGHEMIVAGMHFFPGSWPESRLYSSGIMTSDEHFQFFKITVSGIDSCYNTNPHAKDVVVFQNWLKPAGASFDHLHKQIVAVDRYGVNMDRLLTLTRKNPDIFNQLGPEMASKFHLMIAENEHAMAFADIGHMYPTVTVQTRSGNTDPCCCGDHQLRGMSDLVHAVHCAMGNSIPCNEEWYYSPRGSDVIMPWRVCIKQRINTPAGFEGITGIYINPIDPLNLRNILSRQLLDAKGKGLIAGNLCLNEL